MMLSELASSFRCNGFEDYICINANMNTKNADITLRLCAYLMRLLHTNNKLIKGLPNYICMTNLKKMKPFLLCFHELTKSLMQLLSELLKDSQKTAIMEYGKKQDLCLTTW